MNNFHFALFRYVVESKTDRLALRLALIFPLVRCLQFHLQVPAQVPAQAGIESAPAQ